MRIIAISLLLLMNIALEGTLFQGLRFFGTKPDFTLMLIVSIGLLRGKNYGTFSGLAGGLLLDIIYGKVFGIAAITYMLIGYLAGVYSEKVFKDSVIPAVIFNVIAVGISQTIFYLFYYLTNSFGYFGLDLLTLFLEKIIPLAVYNGVLCIFVYKLMQYMDKRKFLERRIY